MELHALGMKDILCLSVLNGSFGKKSDGLRKS